MNTIRAVKNMGGIMDTELFKVVSSKTIKVSRFEIFEDELKVGNSDALYSYVKIKPGICVIIDTPDGFAVLKEYRYPIKSWSYEFVVGIIDDGETPAEAAIREVKEETGFIVDEITSLGEFYPSFGATNEVIYLFYAKCRHKEEAEKEPTELITHETVKSETIIKLIMEGKFKHGAEIGRAHV